jgi:6-phosphogluconolactonase (cycloisomerase 2 family)
MIEITEFERMNPLNICGKFVPFRFHRTAALLQSRAPLKITLRLPLLPFLTLLLFISPPVRAQSGSAPQYLFVVQGGNSPDVLTFVVDQTTGALTTPVGVNPAPIRGTPPVSNNGAPSAVNSAGTFLFVPRVNSSNASAVSVFSIASTGGLTELAASPFSAGDATYPLGLAISLDGKYLYALSGSSNATPNAPLLDVYSIGTDGTLAPLQNYSLSQHTTYIYLHPTGQWLYAYSDADSTTSSIEQFSISPSGTLTDNGGFSLEQYSNNPSVLVGDNSGKYLYALHGQFAGSSTIIDSLSVNGGGGGLSLLSTYTTLDAVQPESEAIDSTGGFLYSTVANFSTASGILTLLQLNNYDIQFLGPIFLASRTSPFLFVTGLGPGDGQGQTQAGNYYLDSYVVGSGGTLTAAPGSPYTLPLNAVSVAITGTPPAPTEPFLTLPGNSVTFGSISPGQNITSSILLSSTGFSPLVISSISISGDASFSQTSNCLTTLAPGSTCTINLEWAPTSAGTLTGTLNIASNAPTAAVSLTGTTAPAVPFPVVTPMSLTFPSTAVGVSSATQIFTVTNFSSATAPLQMSGIGFSGSNPNDFSQTNTCSGAIPIGGSCSIVVTFTPLAQGGRSATIVATTNDSNSPTLSSIVSGVGVSAITQYQLQTSAVGPGTIQQIPSGTTFNANTSITLTAIPNANSTFTSWAGACTGSANTVCTFSITANTSVTATFTANPAVSVSQSQQSGAAGSTFVFQINEAGFATQPTLTANCSIPSGGCSISGTTLTVTTTARSSAFAPVNFPLGPFAWMAALTIPLLLAGPRVRRVLRPAALFACLILLAACGGNSGGVTTPSTGTPAATYAITIHATAGAQTATTTVLVIVQ